MAVLTVSLVLAVLAVPVLMPGRVVAAPVAGALLRGLLRPGALGLLPLLRLEASAALSLLPASALSLLSALGALAGPTIDLRALYGRPLTLAALLGGRPAAPLPRSEEHTSELQSQR